MITDAELVRRCLAGESDAWRGLLERYSDLVHALLRRAGLDEPSIEDAFQEVALLLWKNLRRLRDTERLASWVGTTTRRIAWRARRRARTREVHENAARRDDVLVQTDPGASVEEEQALREALGHLGARCRELLSLLYFQSSEASYEEVARKLSMPRGSLGPTRARCLEALRHELLLRGVGAEVSDSAVPASLQRGASRPPKDEVQ